MLIIDWVHLIAGTIILITLGLGVEASPLFIHKYFLFGTAFVGANLLQFGITKFCPMATILRALGVAEKGSCLDHEED
jgi:hypothetical protein